MIYWWEEMIENNSLHVTPQLWCRHSFCQNILSCQVRSKSDWWCYVALNIWLFLCVLDPYSTRYWCIWWSFFYSEVHFQCGRRAFVSFCLSENSGRNSWKGDWNHAGCVCTCLQMRGQYNTNLHTVIYYVSSSYTTNYCTQTSVSKDANQSATLERHGKLNLMKKKI